MQGALCVMGVALAESGDRAAKRAIAIELEARATREPISPVSRAVVAAAHGDVEIAMTLAHEALARRDPQLPTFGQSSYSRALNAIPAFRPIICATGVTLRDFS
jgi:hypothetical protein